MPSFPAPIRSYLEQISIAARAPAFLLASPQGIVLDAGGELARYGLATLQGQPLPPPWQFLHDFLTLDEETLDLPCVKIGDRGSIDLHLMPGALGVWIVILDAVEQEARQRAVQQKTNELSLLDGRQQKLLRQYVGSGIAETLSKQHWDPASQGERKVVTILFADIRGFTPYCESTPAGQVFATLNSYLRAMIDPILAQEGWIDKLVGDQVMALFGLLPAVGEPAARAVRAALQIVTGVRGLLAQGTVEVELGVGIGISTGPVALGILGTKERRSFSAIGHHVNVAARLESQARRGEILIDSASYQTLGAERAHFTQKLLALKGLAAPVQAYSCELP